jgi:poly(hydroxyalkanoate) depolymerase family esterase
MRPLSDTLARLAAMKARAAAPLSRSGPSRLVPFRLAGANPGHLDAKAFIPSRPAPGAALVVVLHGCTQTADGYDHGSGWSALAEEQGFYLLFPEQQRANNPNLCFNWFLPEHTQRGRGEAASIRGMIEEMSRAHAIDPRRVFITGLSAGGAMAATMLATYPEVFARRTIRLMPPTRTPSSISGATCMRSNAAPRPSGRSAGAPRANGRAATGK